MKNLFYTIAKALVEKHEINAKKKEENEKREHSKRIVVRNAHNLLIDTFKKRFLEEIIDEFKKNNPPKFEVGEKVVTNWYGEEDAWEGSVSLIQSCTPYHGPIDVEIKEVVFDCSQLSEYIDEANRRGNFDAIELLGDYGSFKMTIYKIDYLSKISWAYTIKVVADDLEYWRYSWRENKFLNPKSEEAKWSKKAYKNEMQSHRLYTQKKLLDEKIKKQIEKANHRKVITYP